MSAEHRKYSMEQRAEAVGLAASLGVLEASRRLAIPHRTISNWKQSPAMQGIIVRSQEDVAAKLWEAVVAGTEAVLAGLRDPNARLSDKARALEVVAQQHALLSGGITSRTEQVSSQPVMDREAAQAMRFYLESELERREAEAIPEETP